MDLKEKDVNTRNYVDSGKDRDLLESRCECGIEPPDFISHGINYFRNSAIQFFIGICY